MTPVGHLIVGTAIGILCLPKGCPKSRAVVHVSSFAFLANIPDLALPSWGHEKYYFSHSIFVNLLLMFSASLVILLFPPVRRLLVKGKVIYLFAIVAWMSHFLLDSFYNHGNGIAIFWPFSSAKLVLPIPWLTTFKGSMLHLTFADLKVFFFEVLTFSPLLMVAVAVRTVMFPTTSREQQRCLSDLE